ncbi:hypothetical protein TNCV_1519311 [Trichonephila clavipes]|nr:hypothetical protein TNCV_1519311 [Trichonephila clavipes]
MIRAWCLSRPNAQKGLIYVKYVAPQTFYPTNGVVWVPNQVASSSLYHVLRIRGKKSPALDRENLRRALKKGTCRRLEWKGRKDDECRCVEE